MTVPKGYKGREKTDRLHMLVSPEELEAIDDWQHSNKIATRSEAVRRLVQVGLRYLEHLPAYAAAAQEVTDKVSSWEGELREMLDRKLAYEHFKSVAALSLLDNLTPLADLQEQAHEMHRHMVAEINTVLIASSLPHGIARADVRKEIGKQAMDELRSRIEDDAKGRLKGDPKGKDDLT